MIGPTVNLAGRLLINGLKFQVQKRTGKPGRIQALSLEITHRCIARCVMCNIWRVPKEVPDISINDWLHLLSSGLFSDLRELDITGGEPFLRKDLPELFQGVCDLRQINLKNLKSIAITTNGFLSTQVLNVTNEILPILKRHNLDLIIVCAMDAIGEIHDRIRNFRNAWLKVNETIEGLKKFRGKYDNLIIGIKTTILPANVNELQNIANYAESNDLFTIISPRIITKGRYLNSDLMGNFDFSQKDIRTITSFLEGQSNNWTFHSDSLIHYFKKGAVNKPCSCGFNYLFIRSNGDVYLCPLISKHAGNINDISVSNIFHSKTASKIRRKINKFPECKECTEPGLERYSLPYEGFTYLSILLKGDIVDSISLHRYAGLDKYL